MGDGKLRDDAVHRSVCLGEELLDVRVDKVTGSGQVGGVCAARCGCGKHVSALEDVDPSLTARSTCRLTRHYSNPQDAPLLLTFTLIAPRTRRLLPLIPRCLFM